MSFYVAIDTGGTFTDLVSYNAETNAVGTTKRLTTHHNPSLAVTECLGDQGIDRGALTIFKHGTTHVINLLLERAGARVALVTTAGFRDLLDFGRGNRTEAGNLFFRRDTPLVPHARRLEINERTAGDGEIITPVDPDDVARIADEIRNLDVESVAVCFMNAYANPENEQSVVRTLRDALPDAFVTSGTELSREWFEFERTATGVANAYCGPAIRKYLSNLENALKDESPDVSFLMMGSSGGVLSTSQAAMQPIQLVESGPVGGCIGAAHYGAALGIAKIIAFDMGGTTAKCALVVDGEFGVEQIYHIGGYATGIPVRSPVVDIVEVGAGGGSIARVDSTGRFRVGPQSAGSTPGPVCYGRGGTEPTVTDANLVLGRLDPRGFQNGKFPLHLDGAREAIAEKIAAPLSYTGERAVERAAAGVLALAGATMSEAIKRITVARGVDPREFVLFVYGGGGPLHAREIAAGLGIDRIVVPPEAGNFSALGMLLADIRLDRSLTRLIPIESGAAEKIQSLLRELRQSMHSSAEAAFGDKEMVFGAVAEMRFIGQSHAIDVPLDLAATEEGKTDMEELKSRFLDRYRDRYGFSAGGMIEIVTLKGSLTGTTPRPDLEQLAGLSQGAAASDGAPATSTRPVYFRTAEEWLDTPVIARSTLSPGDEIEGPTIVEEYGSATVIGPGDRIRVGELGELDIRLAGRTGA